MICIHEVIYSVCSRNFCGILSASEDFMTHDEMMSLLANTLADAAGHAGCLPILDCFSPHPGEEVTVSIPMCDDTVDIVLEDLDFPHEWEELLENSGADTMGDLVDYLCYCSQNNISLSSLGWSRIRLVFLPLIIEFIAPPVHAVDYRSDTVVPARCRSQCLCRSCSAVPPAPQDAYSFQSVLLPVEMAA